MQCCNVLHFMVIQKPIIKDNFWSTGLFLYFVNMDLDALIIVYVSKHNRDIKYALKKYEMVFRLYQAGMQKMMKKCCVWVFASGKCFTIRFLFWNCCCIFNQWKAPSIEMFLQFVFLFFILNNEQENHILIIASPCLSMIVLTTFIFLVNSTCAIDVKERESFLSLNFWQK